MDKFESDVKTLEEKCNDEWAMIQEILSLIDAKDEGQEIQMTLVYENLGIKHPYLRNTTVSNLIKEALDWREQRILSQLDIYTFKEDEEDLKKLVEMRRNYRKAHHIWWENYVKGPDWFLEKYKIE